MNEMTDTSGEAVTEDGPPALEPPQPRPWAADRGSMRC